LKEGEMGLIDFNESYLMRLKIFDYTQNKQTSYQISCGYDSYNIEKYINLKTSSGKFT